MFINCRPTASLSACKLTAPDGPFLRTQWPSLADGSTLALYMYHCADTKRTRHICVAMTTVSFTIMWEKSDVAAPTSSLILLPVGSPDGSVGIVTTCWTSEELGSVPGTVKTTVLEQLPDRLWGPPSLFNEKRRYKSTSS